MDEGCGPDGDEEDDDDDDGVRDAFVLVGVEEEGLGRVELTRDDGEGTATEEGALAREVVFVVERGCFGRAWEAMVGVVAGERTEAPIPTLGVAVDISADTAGFEERKM